MPANPPAKATIPAALRDIRSHLKKEDVDGALTVLREGLKAKTFSIASSKVRGKAQPQVSTLERADHPTRIACAKILLEYGFGKPVVQQKIEWDDGSGGGHGDTASEIAERIKEAGVNVDDVLDTYVKGLAKADDA